MASTHKHIRSSTANKRPTTAIADGQIALNTNASSPGLFFKDSTGAIIIKIGPVHVGSTAPNATPGAGGSSGNSTGEIWLDNSLTPVGVKIWNGSAWVNATPVGSTTVQGLLELATSAETQAGTDTDRAVTPAGLQSKVSDSTSTTSSTTIASSTAVKSAYDLANAALPKSGGTITGNLEIGTTGSLSFEGSTADAFETTVAVTDPTADRTITLPDTTGTVVTTGDTGTVTSTMIANGTIVNGDINASAAIAGTKIFPDFGSQTVQTTGIFSNALGTAAAPTVTFTGDTNTGIYSPGADQVAISTNGAERLRVTSGGSLFLGESATDLSPRLAVIGSGGLAVQNAGSSGTYLYVTPSAANGVVDVKADARSGSAPPLTLTVGGNERLRITSAGLVGVGTNSPGSLLTLKQSIAASSDAAPTFIKLENGSDGGSAIEFSNAVAAKAKVALGVEGTGTATDDTFIGFSTSLNTTLSEKVRITSSGNVGIGTSVPSNIFHVSGTAGTPAVFERTGTTGTFVALKDSTSQTFIGNTNGVFSIQTPGSSYSDKLVVTSAGLVGIGTTSPGAALSVTSGSAGLMAEFNSTNANGGYFSLLTSGSVYGDIGTAAQCVSGGSASDFCLNGRGSRSLVLGTNNTERARIDSSGRLLVGTSSSSAEAKFIVQGGATGSGGGMNIQRSVTTASAGSTIGFINFTNSSNNVGATFIAEGDGTWSAGTSHPTRLVFSTTADGGSSPTERMRITSGGTVGIGITNPTSSFADGNGVQLWPSGVVYSNRTSNPSATFGRNTSTGDVVTFAYGSAATNPGVVGSVSVTASATAYNTSSDYRLKENVEPIIDGIARLQELKPSRFNFIVDPNRTVDGFIAHEVQEIVPEAITGEKDAVDDDGNPVYQGIDQSKLVPLLTAALQEAIGRIETLEAEVAALKA